jgi:dephospho-CoA kinase
MLRVGLTGGIATGKSRVRARLAECGLLTIDLDQVAHVVIEPGRPAHGEIVQAFGSALVAADGQIDRRALGAIVFSDAAARDRLNAIVHPRVFEEEARMIAALSPGPHDVVVTDATLLVESGFHLQYARLVVTHCDRRQQLGRVMQRDGLSAGAAQARIASQMPGDDKVRYAHYVIDTGGELATTDAAARAAAEALKGAAAAWPPPVLVDASRMAACLERGPSAGAREVSPLRLLDAIAEAGQPPLAALTRELVPPHRGPWYEAGASPASRPGPETLMAPVTFWSLAQHGPDIPALLAAATSVARLTHAQPAALAGAAAFALALRETVLQGGVPSDLAARVKREGKAIERWTDSPVPSWITAVLEAAGRGQGRLRASARARDGERLVAALLGLGQGPEAGARPAAEATAAAQRFRERMSRR